MSLPKEHCKYALMIAYGNKEVNLAKTWQETCICYAYRNFLQSDGFEVSCILCLKPIVLRCE